MTIDRERVREIFSAALELPPAEQSRYLAEVAPDENHLIDEVRLLLNLDRQADAAHFLDSSALQIEAERLAQGDDARVGEHLMEFKILGVIGAGGMGTI